MGDNIRFTHMREARIIRTDADTWTPCEVRVAGHRARTQVQAQAAAAAAVSHVPLDRPPNQRPKKADR